MVDRYNIIYLHIYVIGIGDKSLPFHCNKRKRVKLLHQYTEKIDR